MLSFFYQKTRTTSSDEQQQWVRTVSYTGTQTPGERGALACSREQVKLFSLNQEPNVMGRHVLPVQVSDNGEFNAADICQHSALPGVYEFVIGTLVGRVPITNSYTPLLAQLENSTRQYRQSVARRPTPINGSFQVVCRFPALPFLSNSPRDATHSSTWIHKKL